MPVVCYKPFSITVSGGATWAFWFKRSMASQDQKIWSYQSNPSGFQIQVYWGLANTITVSVPGISTATGPFMFDVNVAIFNLVLVTWSKVDGLVRVYVNDVLRIQTGTTVDLSTGATAGVIHWDGPGIPGNDEYYWDEMAMWASNVFSPAERAALYAGGTGESYPYPATIPTPTDVFQFNNTLTDSILGITMVNFPVNNDFQPGKFAQAFHSNPGPAAFNLSTSAQAGLRIP